MGVILLALLSLEFSQNKAQGWDTSSLLTRITSRAKTVQSFTAPRRKQQKSHARRSRLLPPADSLKLGQDREWAQLFFPSSSCVASERDPQFLTVPLLFFLLSFRPSSSAFEYCSHPILGRRTQEARVPKCSRGAFPHKRCFYAPPHPLYLDTFENTYPCKEACPKTQWQ